MSGYLNFHRIAAARGDGLHPRLRELLEVREKLAATDASLVDIAAERCDRPVQAGPNPARALPQFLPGNVVRFEPAVAKAAASPRKSSTSSAK